MRYSRNGRNVNLVLVFILLNTDTGDGAISTKQENIYKVCEEISRKPHLLIC